MIINPGELKFGIRAGPYPVITTVDSFAEFTSEKEKEKGKKKKNLHDIELSGPILPLIDTLGARIFELDLKKKTFRPKHSKSHLKKIKDFKNAHDKEKEEREKEKG